MSYPAGLVRRIGDRTDESSVGSGSTRTRAPIDSREVSTVAATIDIEVDSGVYTEPIRRHQGYWAGDFSQRPRPESS
jgi:hypothetical protein